MGLTATVYCDCLERGRLTVPPHRDGFVCVEPSGARSPVSVPTLEASVEFDTWNDSACIHKGGELLWRRIGNIAFVATLRTALEADGVSLPVLLDKFLYDGVHCGDWIVYEDVLTLAEEAKALREIRLDAADAHECLVRFRVNLDDLLEAALSVRKPIEF